MPREQARTAGNHEESHQAEVVRFPAADGSGATYSSGGAGDAGGAPWRRLADVQDTARQSDVDEWGRSEHARRLARAAGRFYYKRWFRVEWEHIERIPATGGALLIANHAGAIPPDTPMIMQGVEEEIGRPVYGLADMWFRTVPFVGTVWSRSGGVAAHPDNAHRLLHEQQQLCIVHPEGQKGPSKNVSERYKLRRFGRGGFVETAMRAGVPVVPIAVLGAEEAMPILYKLPVASLLKVPYLPVTVNQFVYGPLLGTVAYLPAKFRFRVLEPVHFDVRPNQAKYPRSLILEEAEAIREKLQENLYDMLSKRRSVWFG